MSLARVHTWVTNEGLLASDLNGEFDNIRNNPGSLISPMTANLAAAGFRITGLAAPSTSGDMVRFDDIPVVATQAQQETGSNTALVVTPGRQQFHASACKGWATADYAATASSSYNLSAITDTGPGAQAYVWDVDFSSSAYTCIASCDNNGTVLSVSAAPSNSTNVSVQTRNAAGTLTDGNKTCCAVFGDQA